MSLEKFKNIKTTVRIDTDAEYSKKLATLPENKGGGSVMRVILSVAAAFILVAAVGMWMLIGGAIRNQGEHTADPPHPSDTVAGSQGEDKPEVNQLTEEVKSKLELFAFNKKVYVLPEFDEKNPLNSEQVLRYFEYTGNAYNAELIFTREQFSALAQEIFGYDMTISEDIVYEYIETSHFTVEEYEATAFTVAAPGGKAMIEYTFESGDKLTVTVTYTDIDSLDTSRILSVSREKAQNTAELTIQEKFENIAKEYHFYAIHPFEEGTLPYYVRYHVSRLMNKSRQFYNGKGGTFLGLPLDEYNETIIKYYGKSDMEDKTPIDFNEMTGYIKYADLVKTDDGVYVNLEIGGGLESRFECIDVQYGTTQTGEKCVSVTYNEYYIGSDRTVPDVRTVCYTTDDNLTPKRFVSCTVATSETSDSAYIINTDEVAFVEITPAVYGATGITVTDIAEKQRICALLNFAPLKEKAKNTVTSTGSYNYIKFYDADDNVIKSIPFDSDWFDLDGYRYTVEKDYFEPILSQLESEFAKVDFDPKKPFAHLNADSISSITVCTQKNGLSSVTDKTAIKSIIEKLTEAECTKASDTEQTTDFISFLDNDRKCLLSVINLSPSGFTVTYPENVTYTADADILQLVNSIIE